MVAGCAMIVSSFSSNGSSREDISDEVEDCDSLWLCDDAERVVEVEVETELILWVVVCLATTFLEAIVARDIVASPDIGTTGGAKAEEGAGSGAERSRPAARKRTPSLMAAFADGMMDDTIVDWVAEDELAPLPEGLADRGDGVEYARSIPLLTIRSHLRFSWASSVSWVAS